MSLLHPAIPAYIGGGTSKMKARESALACHDILATIFGHLTWALCVGEGATEKLRQSCQRALASSARVCSTLSHHALNVLWRELASVHPLLKTLPNCKLVASQLTLCGAISDQDWTRLQFYAKRVRAITGTLEPELLDLVHPSVWLYLSARCKGLPLMPYLSAISAFDVRTSEAPALILLISPSLRSLHIWFALEDEADERPSAPHVASSLLQTLPLVAPNLETLHSNIDIGVGHGYLETFGQFTRLEDLSVSSELGLDDSALQKLSAITTLRKLSCEIDISKSSSLTLGPYPFPNLTVLAVVGGCDDLAAFISACQLPSFPNIELVFQRPPRIEDLTDSFAVMCQKLNPALLTFIRASIVYAPGSSRIVRYFEPLLAFPNITSFNLAYSNTGVVASIHDDDLAQCGAAWPRLTGFRVLYSAKRRDIVSSGAVVPTLSGLVDLARRCPHLATFFIPALDAKVFPDKNATLPLGHGLRSITIMDSIALPSPESRAFADVARVLVDVFPSTEMNGMKNTKRWDKLVALVNTLRLRREA